MQKPTLVGLLLGGSSTEHEISLKSARFIYETLDRANYQVKPILISKSGVWWVPSEFEKPYPSETELDSDNYALSFEKAFCEKQGISPENRTTLVSLSNLENIQVFFNGLHGGAGEDGRVQGFLETIGKPYTGSGVLASALAMDKKRSNLLFDKWGLKVAPNLEIEKKDKEKVRYILENSRLQFPVFLKPTLGGSSVCTSRASEIGEAVQFLKKAFETEDRFLVQELIQGTEVSIGVVEKWNGTSFHLEALVPTEIRPKSEFFDYKAKYTKGGSEEITPAPVSKSITTELQKQAIIAHEGLGCAGYSRTDFIIRDGVPHILETNTLPGMTGTSLIPQQAKAVGIEMKDLFHWLLQRALWKESHPN